MKGTVMKIHLVLTLSILTLFPPQFSQAHEGHATPGSMQARHGGMIKQTKNLFIELVTEGTTLKIYPMDHEYNPVPLDKVRLDSTVEFPKGKKGSGKLSLTNHIVPEDGKSHFMGTVDPQGANRFTLKLKATYLDVAGDVKFTVEPK